MTAAPLVAGLEFGGTRCNAVLAQCSRVIARATVPTTTPTATLESLATIVAGWTALHPVAAIGIAGFGPLGLDSVTGDYGHILATPKPGWSHTDVRGHFVRAFGLPTGFDTDVNGAALAEGEWGASTGCDVHAYVTIGTGVGVGIVVDGRPLHGALHPEAGHMRVRRAGPPGFAGSCAFHGDCVEGLVSGPAIAARAGIEPGRIGNADPIWAVVASDLGELLANLILMLAPRRIVVGGGVLQARPQLLVMARVAAATSINAYLPGTAAADLADRIVPPLLGSDAGALGAALLGARALATAQLGGR